MVDYIIIILLMGIQSILLFTAFKLMKASITITYKQELNAEDRQLLEDLYNKEGDLKDADTAETLDQVVQAINEIMLGSEEQTNG